MINCISFKMQKMKSNLFFLILSFIIFSTPDVFGQNSEIQPITLRVLTYNIFHGATMKDDFNLDLIANVISDLNPDLVALQEVDFKTNRAKKMDLATELGYRTKMTSIFGKAMNYNGGAYGVAILTKMPVVASRNVPLPFSAGNEPRTSLGVTIELHSGDTIHFVCTHLDHQKNSTDRIDQANRINEIFLKNSHPAVLAGDLNDSPDSETISILKKHWSDSETGLFHPTYPSQNPKQKIDYILFQPSNRWKVAKTRVVCDSVSSDHCAVFSELQLVK